MIKDVTVQEDHNITYIKDAKNVLEQHSQESISFWTLLVYLQSPVELTVVQIIAIYISSHCKYSKFTDKLDKFMIDIDIISIIKIGDFNMKSLTQL